ncbi:MAG TPA: 5'-3' exonuclease H3TH domain-containing protein [Steroidobacteraceae bacterium]|nr:5'-3' exonuclease H3TH domain-containing protein [Steroidobacteraceae bacterium]
MTPAGPPAVHLIDASYFVFRAWYSVGIEMTDGDGQPVNALYGFGRFLGDLLEQAKPEHVAVAFDESLTTSFRNEIFPAYKKNREPAPPELRRQFALCRELCRLLGVAEFGSPTHEADDIIGTLAARLRAAGHCAVLVTRDKDLAQLVRDGDHYWDYAGARRFAYAEIEAQFGVRPERMADYLALTGDAVDNIPGVPGVGPKTAAALLSAFASLEELYEGLDRVGALPIRGAAKLAGKLRDHRDAAYLARRLTVIACDTPLEFSLEALRRRKPDLAALGAFYDRQKFGLALRRQAERLAQH